MALHTKTYLCAKFIRDLKDNEVAAAAKIIRTVLDVFGVH